MVRTLDYTRYYLVCVLPLDWILSSYENVIRLCKLSCSSTSAQVDLCVAIKQDLSWLLTYRDSIVDVDKCSALSQAPPVMDSGTNPLPLVLYVTVLFLMLVDKVKALLKLDDVQPCCGNSDNRFLSLTNIHKGIMLDKSSKCISVCS